MTENRWSALIDAWWEAYRLSQGGRAERKALELGQPASAVAAEDRVREIVDEGGQEAIELLAALAHATSDDSELAYLGAGPIEDLARFHGVSAAAQLAEAARLDPHFARAVARMWIPADLASAGKELLAPWVGGGRA